MDCKMVVEDTNLKPNRSEYDFIINKCCSLLLVYKSYIVVFDRQQTNDSAHALPDKIELETLRESHFQITSQYY
jgi:hypothetical protein